MDHERTINEAISTVDPIESIAPSRKRKRDEPEPIEEEDDNVLTLCSVDEKKRFLIRQVNALRKTHPDAFERTIAFGDDPFASLEEKQLREFLGILKEEAGIAGPYDDAQAVTAFLGTIFEKTLKLEGLAKLLSTDPEIVSLVHEYIPSKWKNYSGFAKLGTRIADILGSLYSRDNNAQPRTSQQSNLTQSSTISNLPNNKPPMPPTEVIVPPVKNTK